MTDKVQKIREKVEKLKSQLIRGACSSQIAMETRCKEEAYDEVLAILDSMQEEPKVCMYSKDNYTDEDRKPFVMVVKRNVDLIRKKSHINNGLDLGCGVIWKDEEPVSEDLEEAARRYAALQAGMKDAMTSEYYEEYPYSQNDIKAFKAGANWKEQKLIAKAVDIEVKVDAGDYPYIPQIELYDYVEDIPLTREGDKYKVILIKED